MLWSQKKQKTLWIQDIFPKILDNVQQQQRLSLTFDELDDDDVIHTALIYINVEEKK